MNRLQTFYGTSIGKKIVVAITGVIMYGFVIGHMLGNLKAFGGATALVEPALGHRHTRSPPPSIFNETPSLLQIAWKGELGESVGISVGSIDY